MTDTPAKESSPINGMATCAHKSLPQSWDKNPHDAYCMDCDTFPLRQQKIEAETHRIYTKFSGANVGYDIGSDTVPVGVVWDAIKEALTCK